MDGTNNEIRILCVDDEPNVLNALRRLFLDEDYTILTASSGQEGIELLEQAQVQIVISDYRMPSMNGVEFLTAVYKRWPDTVRIVLSGYADTASIVSAINDGHIYKFIPKPWNDEELKITIMNSIERYFLLKKNRELSEELSVRNAELQALNRELAQLVTEKVLHISSQEMILRAQAHVVDAIPVGILGIDQHGLIVLCNATCSEILGLQSLSPGTNIEQLGSGQLQDLTARVFDTGSIAEDMTIGDSRYRVLANLLDPRAGQPGAMFAFLPACA